MKPWRQRPRMLLSQCIQQRIPVWSSRFKAKAILFAVILQQMNMKKKTKLHRRRRREYWMNIPEKILPSVESRRYTWLTEPTSLIPTPILVAERCTMNCILLNIAEKFIPFTWVCRNWTKARRHTATCHGLSAHFNFNNTTQKGDPYSWAIQWN